MGRRRPPPRPLVDCVSRRHLRVHVSLSSKPVQLVCVYYFFNMHLQAVVSMSMLYLDSLRMDKAIWTKTVSAFSLLLALHLSPILFGGRGDRTP